MAKRGWSFVFLFLDSLKENYNNSLYIYRVLHKSYNIKCKVIFKASETRIPLREMSVPRIRNVVQVTVEKIANSGLFLVMLQLYTWMCLKWRKHFQIDLDLRNRGSQLVVFKIRPKYGVEIATCGHLWSKAVSVQGSLVLNILYTAVRILHLSRLSAHDEPTNTHSWFRSSEHSV